MGQNLNGLEDDKRQKHRVVYKIGMGRARQKMTEEQLEERRIKGRDRYQRKKEQDLVKNISDVTPREKRITRKRWKDASKRYRQKKKNIKALEVQTENIMSTTPPASPSVLSQSPKVLSGQQREQANRRLLKQDNLTLKLHLRLMEARIAKYKTRLRRSQVKLQGILTRTMSKNIIALPHRREKQWKDFLKMMHAVNLLLVKRKLLPENVKRSRLGFFLTVSTICLKSLLMKLKSKCSMLFLQI